ncbi:MAG: ATP-binding protein [Chloroflexi bacterium]|nr:ATP-binding protein [Chloroflexota bacterium]MYI82208.1 ATP-binding protein [Chloroflexota bacterium]
MSASLSLTVKTARDELERITAAIDNLAEEDDWPADLLFRVQLVLEELALNIVDYGHDDDTSDFEIAFMSEGDSLTIEIVDGGRAFDPLNDAPEPDLTSGVAERRVGGLGVHFVRTLMDDVQYERSAGKNRLKMVTRKVR